MATVADKTVSIADLLKPEADESSPADEAEPEAKPKRNAHKKAE
jgi:hypothetical protein